MREMKDEMLSIREVLQSVEEALIDKGYDQITIRTEQGLFTWVMDDRAVVNGESEPPEC